MIKKRLNIRMSGLGGQGAVTAAHVMAMAANRDGKFSISNPFFGAEKRMAPAESYCRIGIERIYDRGELVFPDVIEVFHPQVITMGKSYTMPFYSGVKEGGVVIINSAQPLLSEEDIQRLKDLNVSLFYIAGTELAIEVAGTELSTNMSMIGSVAGITKCVTMEALDVPCRSVLERNSWHPVERPHWTRRSRKNSPRKKCCWRKIWRRSSAPTRSQANGLRRTRSSCESAILPLRLNEREGTTSHV